LPRARLVSRSAVLAAVLLASCSEGPLDPLRPAPRAHDARRFFVPEGQPAFTALPGATAYYGTHQGVQGDAGYRIEVPDAWNGVLVMFAHGYRGTGAELIVSSPSPGLRERWIAGGYAWAASSYSANYYDVRAGVEDTNDLALLFTDLTGLPAPSKRYIVGQSMGGHVAGAGVEEETLATAVHRVEYAGALAMCGVMGDIDLYGYFVGYNVAAYELAGIPLSSFPIPAHGENLPAIKEGLWVDYEADRGAMTPQGEKLKHVLMHLSGGPRPIFDLGFPGFQDLLLGYGFLTGDGDGIFAGLVVNTGDLEYQLDEDAALSAEEVDFNAAVFRVLGDFLAHNPLRSDGVRAMPILWGRFDVPVVTLHGLGDLWVPFAMEQVYARRAAANGNGHRLVQRAIRAPGHCGFTAEEATAAFDALVDWETNGVVPTGDDVLDPQAVSEPSYGCSFTTMRRPGLPACP
jgi:predicted alpha/beta hydrolase